MKPVKIALLWWVGVTVFAHAQSTPMPQILPPTIINLPTPEPSTLPIIRNGPRPETPAKPNQELTKFNPDALIVDRSDNRFRIKADDVLIRDFGYDRVTAEETLRLMKELRVNQLLTVPGARPMFQLWLLDGKPSPVTATRQVFLPITAQTLRAEEVGGVWVVTDGSRSLYDFGADGPAAKHAATLLVKHGYNQIGIVGNPRPVVLYPILNEVLARRQQQQPPITPVTNSLGVIDDVARQNLILPGNVLVGKKTPIELVQLQTARVKTGEWGLLHHDDLLGKFGSIEYTARAALRALTDMKATEMVRVGSKGLPIFLNNGLPLRGRPTGATCIDFRADRLKLQQIRGDWWLGEDARPLFKVGTKADAELLLKTLQSLNIRVLGQYGHPDTGGLALFTAGF